MVNGGGLSSIYADATDPAPPLSVTSHLVRVFYGLMYIFFLICLRVFPSKKVPFHFIHVTSGFGLCVFE